MKIARPFLDFLRKVSERCNMMAVSTLVGRTVEGRHPFKTNAGGEACQPVRGKVVAVACHGRFVILLETDTGELLHCEADGAKVLPEVKASQALRTIQTKGNVTDLDRLVAQGDGVQATPAV